MRLLYVTVLFQASAGPEITSNDCVCVYMHVCVCTRVKISALPCVIVSLIHSSINTELIRFNLAAQPAVPSLNIFFIPSQPPFQHALSFSFHPHLLLCICFPSLNCFFILYYLHNVYSSLAALSQQVYLHLAENVNNLP